MTHRARSRPVAAAVLLSLSFGITPPARAADAGPAERTATRFRSEFGLRSDLDLVRQMSIAVDANLDWGLPLTDAEAAEMNRRRDLAAGMDGLNSYAGTIPGIASVYFDQPAGGEIVVAIAGDPEPYRNQIARLVPPSGTFRLRQVEHPRADLLALLDRIVDDRDILLMASIEVNSGSIDEVANLVRIGVTDLTPASRAVMEARYGGSAMLALYSGGKAALTDTGCTSRIHCYGPPLRAGIHNGNGGCSLAFLVNQSGARRILTAGHSPCGSFSGQAWTAHNQTGYYFGTVQTRSWFGSDAYETADGASVGNLTSAQDDNRLYRTPTTWALITSAQISDNYGIPACLSGWKTASNRCGSLVSTTSVICWTGVGCLREQREATYAVYFGDSGGAVYDGGAMAMGIQSSCLDHGGPTTGCDEGDTVDNALYSHIQQVFGDLGGSMSIYTGD